MDRRQFRREAAGVALRPLFFAPCKGRINNPACGSGDKYVQSEEFVDSHGGMLGEISISGQESNATTRHSAIINLAIRSIEADTGKEHADTFRRDLHPDLRADYVLASVSSHKRNAGH